MRNSPRRKPRYRHNKTLARQSVLVLKALQTSIMPSVGYLVLTRNTVLLYVRVGASVQPHSLLQLFAGLFFGGALIGFCLARTIMMSPANVRDLTVPGGCLLTCASFVTDINDVILRRMVLVQAAPVQTLHLHPYLPVDMWVQPQNSSTTESCTHITCTS